MIDQHSDPRTEDTVVFELPKAIAGLRRTDPKAQEKLVDFLVANREVMSYVA